MRYLGLILIALSMCGSPTFSFGAAGRAAVQLLPGVSNVKPGDTFLIAVRFTIEPGWHLYWLNPGESGLPPTVKWLAPPGVTIAAPRFPAPWRILTPSALPTFGYENELVLIAEAKVDEHFPRGPLKIEAKIDWLVCQDVCLAESSNASLTIVVADATGTADERFAAWQAALPRREANLKQTVELTADQSAGRLVAYLPEGVTQAELFPPAMDFAKYAPSRLSNAPDGKTIVVVPFRILAGLEKSTSGDAVLVYVDQHKNRVAIELPMEFLFSR